MYMVPLQCHVSRRARAWGKASQLQLVYFRLRLPRHAASVSRGCLVNYFLHGGSALHIGPASVFGCGGGASAFTALQAVKEAL